MKKGVRNCQGMVLSLVCSVSGTISEKEGEKRLER